MAGNIGVRIKLFFRCITVEPIMFLYMMSSFTNFPAFQALLYRKICVNRYNETFCDVLRSNDDNETFKEQENFIQSQTSYWILMNNVATTVPSCIVVLFFLSTLVDRVSHKLTILITTVGSILFNVSNLIASIYPHVPVSYLLIGSIVNGLGGGFIAMMMSIYSYITIITTENNKTFRVSVVEAMIFLAGTIGVFTSGLMVDNLGFVFTFSFITGLLVLVVFYVIIWLPDIRPNSSAAENQDGLSHSILSRFYGILEFVGRDREDRKKLYISIMILILLLIMVSTSGENDIMYLYVTRDPLAWSRTLFGYFKGLENFLRGAVLLVVLPVLKFKMKLRDTSLIIMGLISKVLGLIMYSFTVTGVIFTGAVLSMLMGFPAAALRSRVSLLVDTDERGRLFGLIASLESIASLLATLLFNELYPASFSFFVGFSFILAAIIVLIGLGLTVWLHFILPDNYNRYGNMELSESSISDEINVN